MNRRVRRDAPSCRSADMYASPVRNQKVSGSHLALKWKPDCMHSNKFDVYLYSQKGDSVLPIHAWLGLNARDGAKTVQLDSKWWDKQQDLHVNLQYVPNGFQPWETSYPLGATWILSANSSETPSNLDTSPSWSNAQVTDYIHHSSGLSGGELAASIVLPVLAALAILGAGLFWHRKCWARREANRSEPPMKPTHSTAEHSAVSFHSPHHAYDSSPIPGELGAMHDSDVSVGDVKDPAGTLYADTSALTQNDSVPYAVYAYEQPYTLENTPVSQVATEPITRELDGHEKCRSTRKPKRERRSEKPFVFESHTWSRSGSFQPDEYNVPEFVSREKRKTAPYTAHRAGSKAPLTMLDQELTPKEDEDKSSSISDGPAMYALDEAMAPSMPKTTRTLPSQGPEPRHKSISRAEPSTEESRNRRILSYLAGVAASQGDHRDDNVIYDNRGGLSSRRPSNDSDVFQDADSM